MRRNIKLAEAPSYGKTIFEYEPRCNGAEDYKMVAEYIHSQTVPSGTEDHVCNGQSIRETVFDVDRVPSGANYQRRSGDEVPSGTEEALKGQTIKGVKEQAEAVVVGEENEDRAQADISKQSAIPIQEVPPEKKSADVGEVPSGTNDHV